jgi:putative hydrolase of the HAD superfamily
MIETAIKTTIETWIFDLDNTLYPRSSGAIPLIEERIVDYVALRRGVSRPEAIAFRKTLLEKYPSTMLGMMACHGVSPHDYLDYCHDVEVAFEHDAALHRALERLPGRKIIHTNAPMPWAVRTLAKLGLTHHFPDIFDIIESKWQPKPDAFGYAEIVRRFGVNPSTCCMIEDTAGNLLPAFQLGMKTVLVESAEGGKPQIACDHIHHRTGDLAGWLLGFAVSLT